MRRVNLLISLTIEPIGTHDTFGENKVKKISIEVKGTEGRKIGVGSQAHQFILAMI